MNKFNILKKLLDILSRMIVRVNPYAELFEKYQQQLKEQERMLPPDCITNLNMYIQRVNETTDTRDYRLNRYNATTGGGQIAALFSDQEGFPPEVFVRLKKLIYHLLFYLKMFYSNVIRLLLSYTTTILKGSIFKILTLTHSVTHYYFHLAI